MLDGVIEPINSWRRFWFPQMTLDFLTRGKYLYEIIRIVYICIREIVPCTFCTETYSVKCEKTVPGYKFSIFVVVDTLDGHCGRESNWSMSNFILISTEVYFDNVTVKSRKFLKEIPFNWRYSPLLSLIFCCILWTGYWPSLTPSRSYLLSINFYFSFFPHPFC